MLGSNTNLELDILRRMAANMVVWAVEMDSAAKDMGALPQQQEQLGIMSGCVKTLLGEYTTFVKNNDERRHND